VKITKNKKSGYTVNMEAETEFADIEKYIDENYEDLVKDVKLDGFRKGKVPKQVFIKKFGEDYLHHQAIYPVLNQSYQNILKEENLNVVSAPYDVDVKELKKGEPLQFTFKVDVLPEIKLKKYKGLKAAREAAAIDDKEIDKMLENLQKNYLNLEETEEAITDTCIIEHELAAEDSEGNKPEAYNKAVFITKTGTGFLGQDFEKNLIGLKKGAEKEFSSNIPEDHQDKDIAGKELNFKVKINKVHREVLPELNDEFIKKVSGKESLEEFKKERKEQMLEQKEKESEDNFVNELMEQLLKENKFDVPPAMIDKEVDNIMNSFAMDLQQRYKTNLDDYLKMINKSHDDLKAEYRENAEKRVKINLLLEEIIKAEKIEATDEEVEKSLEDAVPEQYKGNDAIKNYYREMMKSQIARDKALAMLKETAKK